MYYLYLLKCADGTLYTGIALDVMKRVSEHNSSRLGARYTRSRRPVQLIFSKEVGDQAEALREEYRIKQLSRTAKLALCGM
ncbi:MAG: GIY-YIG nuclease family protein [Candidatus Pacebacteria bacterium]|nr:GIY-YIG nuclease family protein [Candidatus Paceibacterota bacterium]